MPQRGVKGEPVGALERRRKEALNTYAHESGWGGRTVAPASQWRERRSENTKYEIGELALHRRGTTLVAGTVVVCDKCGRSQCRHSSGRQ